MCKQYVEFTVWNYEEERSATEEEMKEHIYIIYHDGKCVVECGEGYGLLTE